MGAAPRMRPGNSPGPNRSSRFEPTTPSCCAWQCWTIRPSGTTTPSPLASPGSLGRACGAWPNPRSCCFGPGSRSRWPLRVPPSSRFEPMPSPRLPPPAARAGTHRAAAVPPAPGALHHRVDRAQHRDQPGTGGAWATPARTAPSDRVPRPHWLHHPHRGARRPGRRLPGRSAGRACLHRGAPVRRPSEATGPTNPSQRLCIGRLNFTLEQQLAWVSGGPPDSPQVGPPDRRSVPPRLVTGGTPIGCLAALLALA